MHPWLRDVYLVYFVTHIPVTIIVDMQALVGHLYPRFMQQVIDWYITNFKGTIVCPYTPLYHRLDPLFIHKPAWFRGMVLCEALFQFPFFFYVVHGFIHRNDAIRIPCIIYGAHVATTVVPILAETLESTEIRDQERRTLLAFYTPYLLIPLSLMIYMAAYSSPFSRSLKRF